LQHQVAEKEMQDKIKSLEKALKESEEARHREQDEATRQLESEKKVHSILQKSYEQVSKELESKTNKIERLQELTKVSKEIATNLQTEKQTLQDQLIIERDTTRRLHTLAESSTDECARMETQLDEAAQVIEKLNRDQETSKKQYVLDALFRAEARLNSNAVFSSL
jgi:DNA repair exonuclease SbcCD ATPase subunit